MRTRFNLILTLLTVSLGVTLAAACSDGSSSPDESQPAPLPTATAAAAPAAEPEGEGHTAAEPTSTAPGDPVTRGRDVYVSAGCVACHGADASGTGIAPGLPGHSELQVRRQTRGPIGAMPVFGPEQLTTEQLDDLAAYVESLGGEHGHGNEAAVSPADASLSHHRMALLAFEAENLPEAEHHIEHLIGLLEGQHLALMQEALEKTLAGEAHDAQHMVEAMLADVSPPDEGLGVLHLKLALTSLRVGSGQDAAHHIDHAVDFVPAELLAEVDELRDLIAEGDLAETEEHLSQVLGVQAIGVDGYADADEHEAGEAHEEGDAHEADEHEAVEAHEEGDAHEADEHEAVETHEEADAHEADEHEADEAHEEGDAHDADEHEADEAHEEGDAHDVDEHEAGEPPAA